MVAVDNTFGIKQAFEHLLKHGHRQIAFIAGNSGRGGDSEERLHGYRTALKDAGLSEDPRLIAYGEHRKEDGMIAMRQILDSHCSCCTERTWFGSDVVGCHMDSCARQWLGPISSVIWK